MDSSNSVSKSQQCGVIYKITNLLNGKCYVGQTIQKLNKRIIHHKNCKTSAIGRAIQKYGWENFSVEVLEICSQDKLNECEKFWIKKNNCLSPNGYNFTDGGDRSVAVVTDEVRAKISAANSGEKNPMYGKPGANRGKTAWNKGLHHTEETKNKISIALKGRKFSDEHKAKISASSKGKIIPKEQREKISSARKGQPTWNKGIPCAEETKRKISETKKARNEEKRRSKFIEGSLF